MAVKEMEVEEERGTIANSNPTECKTAVENSRTSRQSILREVYAFDFCFCFCTELR